MSKKTAFFSRDGFPENRCWDELSRFSIASWIFQDLDFQDLKRSVIPLLQRYIFFKTIWNSKFLQILQTLMHPSVCVLYLEKFIYLLKTEAGKYWAAVLASSNCQITCTSLFPSHKKESRYKNCTYGAFSIIMSNRCHSIQQNIQCSFQITCRNV